MTNNILSQETAKLKDLIASYESNKADIEKQMEGIDEKYRKLAEAEKAALSASAAFYDTAISAISALVNDEVKTEPKKEKESDEPEIKVEQEEEKVVDNLFPENNLPDEVQESAEEEKELDLANMNQDDTVLEFEKEDVPEETEEETKEEEDEEGLSDEGWNEVSQW